MGPRQEVDAHNDGRFQSLQHLCPADMGSARSEPSQKCPGVVGNMRLAQLVRAGTKPQPQLNEDHLNDNRPAIIHVSIA